MSAQIYKQDGKHQGRYFMTIDGMEPESTFIRIPLGRNIIANHVGVPKPLSGQGLALALVKAMIADARENDFKIVAQCPYVVAQYKRHPDWSDVMIDLPDWAS